MGHDDSMNDPSRIPAPDGVAPAARYTPVVTGTGRLVAVSGRRPLDEDGAPVGGGDAAATFDDAVEPAFPVFDMAHTPAVRGARAARVPDGRLIEALAVVPA